MAVGHDGVVAARRDGALDSLERWRSGEMAVGHDGVMAVRRDGGPK